MGVVSRFAFVALVLAPGAAAFLTGPSSVYNTQKLTTRMSPAVCSVRSSVEDTGMSRRNLLGSAFAFASILAMPLTPAFAEGEVKMSGDYKTDVEELLAKMKAATELKKGDTGMKNTVEDARKVMNEFVSYYRRNNKVAGAASFSTLYTAVSTLSGHFQNYGPEYPVPEKRKKRLNQQYAEIEKQLARGR